MSRSGYNEDCDDNWSWIMYRGRVASAARGKRGQKFFRDLIAALDALPEKRLIPDELVRPTGEVCALGALGMARGIALAEIDPEDIETVAGAFDIAGCLARETVFENDEAVYGEETPEARFARVRAWAVSNLRPTPQEQTP